MTRILESRRSGAARGEANQAVIFLHGYGADGADLIGLAEPLAPHMPGTVFLAPDAPEQCAVNPVGRQWFSIPWLDGSDPATSEAGMRRAADDLDAWLGGTLADEALTPDRVVLFGFSQGTMMTLEVALRREAAFAGLVCFSGRLMRPEALADEIRVRPPVLLIHGDIDDVVPPQAMPEAAAALQAAGIDVYAHVMKGTGHGIAPDGLSLALAFMRERLGLEDAG